MSQPCSTHTLLDAGDLVTDQSRKLNLAQPTEDTAQVLQQPSQQSWLQSLLSLLISSIEEQ